MVKAKMIERAAVLLERDKGDRRCHFRSLVRGRHGVLALALFLAGCTTTTAWQKRTAPTGIAPQDSVAIILTRFSEEFSSDKEKAFSRCISDALRGVDPTVRIVSGDEFRRAAFPDLAPDQVPPQPWEELVTDDAFRMRIGPLGLRYLISVSGRTTEDWKFGGAGGGYAAVWGFEIQRDSYLDGTVLDLKEGRKSGQVQASVDGKTIWLYPPAPLVIPISTEAPVCAKIGEEVAKLLSGEEAVGQTDAEPSTATDAKVEPTAATSKSEQPPARSKPEQAPAALEKVEPAPVPSPALGAFANIAGTWLGRFELGATRRSGVSDWPLTLSIKEDGSYEAFGTTRSTGKARIVDGKFVFQLDTGSQVEMFTLGLREHGGKRFLNGPNQDGSLSLQLGQ